MGVSSYHTMFFEKIQGLPEQFLQARPLDSGGHSWYHGADRESSLRREGGWMMRNDWTLPGKIYLLERDPVKCGFLRLYFDRAPEAETVQDGFRHFMETHAVQCVVSPANAFGLMDGGYDLAITEWFGRQLQRRVQQYILDHFRGEQPVGTSFLLEAGRDGQSLIHTPTMRTPQRILDARVIYQCMRTTLMCAAEHAVESIVIPMFGGATGGVRPHLAADMMWRAYAQLKNPPERLDWAYAAEVEIDLP